MLLLKLLVDTQDALATQLTRRADELRAALPPLPDVDSDTETRRRLTALTRASAAGHIERFATLTPEEQEELKQLDIAAATIAADQSRQIEAAARTTLTEVANVQDAGTDTALAEAS